MKKQNQKQLTPLVKALRMEAIQDMYAAAGRECPDTDYDEYTNKIIARWAEAHGSKRDGADPWPSKCVTDDARSYAKNLLSYALLDAVLTVLGHEGCRASAQYGVRKACRGLTPIDARDLVIKKTYPSVIQNVRIGTEGRKRRPVYVGEGRAVKIAPAVQALMLDAVEAAYAPAAPAAKPAAPAPAAPAAKPAAPAPAAPATAQALVSACEALGYPAECNRAGTVWVNASSGADLAPLGLAWSPKRCQWWASFDAEHMGGVKISTRCTARNLAARAAKR